jgi:hypothetical protein
MGIGQATADALGEGCGAAIINVRPQDGANRNSVCAIGKNALAGLPEPQNHKRGKYQRCSADRTQDGVDNPGWPVPVRARQAVGIGEVGCHVIAKLFGLAGLWPCAPRKFESGCKPRAIQTCRSVYLCVTPSSSSDRIF